MNRKQVNAFLKVISKDRTRPVLCSAYIDEYKGKSVLVATDGYVLVAMKLEDIEQDHIGKRVSREAVERWYKLADGRSRLSGADLQDMMEFDQFNQSDLDGVYPQWQKLVPTEARTSEFMSSMSIAFNANYAKVLQDVRGIDGLNLKIYGKLAPMVHEDETGLYILMPMKETK